jgi:hypothetical protein
MQAWIRIRQKICPLNHDPHPDFKQNPDQQKTHADTEHWLK